MMNDLSRFWAKVDKVSHPNGCWEWTGALSRAGYARFMATGESSTHASRFVWRITRGEIPAGMFVCHRCDNPKCVNPDHLWLGTQRDNIHDMMRKGRRGKTGAKGERNGRALLTEDQVREIRQRNRESGIGARRLAREYPASISAINHVISGKNWKDI